MKKEIEKFELIQPTEDNEYCFFHKQLEEDETVFFHVTPKENFNSIIKSGFLSAHDLNLNTSDLTSVSYAKKSSACLRHIFDKFEKKKNKKTSQDYVIFAVKFDSLNKKEITKNNIDINIYDKSIQPHILGYCEIPKGFTHR